MTHGISRREYVLRKMSPSREFRAVLLSFPFQCPNEPADFLRVSSAFSALRNVIFINVGSRVRWKEREREIKKVQEQKRGRTDLSSIAHSQWRRKEKKKVKNYYAAQYRGNGRHL